MSSVVVSGDSSDGALSQATGGEGNPIELVDDSSTNTNTNSNTENETPPGIYKQEDNDSDRGEDSGDENGNNDSDRDEDEDEGSRDGSGEEDEEEESEDGSNDEVNGDSVEIADESVEGDESENDKSDGSDSDDSASSNDSAPKDNGDAPPKVRQRIKHLWGNIESMSSIVRSPYEGNECAEVGEDCFEELRTLMDCSESNGAINPQLQALVGDKLAQDLINAHNEIGKSGMLYSPSWKEGKIRDSDFGWIPKRQLLLCLHEHRFGRKGNDNVLKEMIKHLDCSKLVLEAMEMWDLMDSYPNLASNKGEESFAFGSQKVNCLKCQIFVARSFATLQILNKTERIQPSLTKKVKACLDIMNEHVRVNQIELARMRKKDEDKMSFQSPCSEVPKVDSSTDRKRARGRTSQSSGGRRKANSAVASSKGVGSASGPKKKTTRKRRRKVLKREEREESIFMLFNTMHVQVQRLNQMMSFFQSQLQDHRNVLREEIRENLEKDGNAE